MEKKANVLADDFDKVKAWLNQPSSLKPETVEDSLTKISLGLRDSRELTLASVNMKVANAAEKRNVGQRTP